LRRLTFYVFFDPQGRVDDYVLHLLESLRGYSERIFVVSNSALDQTNRGRLEGVADEVMERENAGFDAWAFKDALDAVGAEALAEYDEVLLLNGTFFGPVGSFDELFDRMDARVELDFWGMTQHEAAAEHAFDRSRPMPAHVQTYWTAVRRSLFTSPVWRSYWDELHPIETYADAVVHHETRFTDHMVQRGFTYDVAFRLSELANPIMDGPEQLVRAGCPVVKRRSFFGHPLHNESVGVDGRTLARLMAERGYPMDHLYANLARTSHPRFLATNLGLLEVLPDVDLGYDHANPLRVVAVVHVFYVELAEVLLDHLDNLPGTYDLVVTTTDDSKRAEIEEILRRRDRQGEVRVVAENRGRDMSAFFVDCRDVLQRADYDLVVKLHTKKSPQDGATVGQLFRRHLLEGLLASPGYAANVLRLFQEHRTLGMVFPPAYHIGYPTLGHAWFGQKTTTFHEARRLGIMVPFDQTTPLAAYGSMFIARPEALRTLVDAGYEHRDFPEESEYGDGTLSHVLERLTSYAVLDRGYHVREVLTADLVALNYSVLEFRAVTVSAHLPAYPRHQVRRIQRLARFWNAHRRRIKDPKAGSRRWPWARTGR
jgi:lipopolysaccharide biosynthesis protein